MNSAELAHIVGAKKLGHGRYSDHCPGPIHRHGDRNPSLVFHDGDEAIVFHCFAGDDSRTVAVGMAQRAGCAVGDFSFNKKRMDGRPARPPLALSLLDQARNEILGEALREPWARDGVLGLYAAADALYARDRLIAKLRAVATGLGDSGRSWSLLSVANALEADLLVAEE